MKAPCLILDKTDKNSADCCWVTRLQSLIEIFSFKILFKFIILDSFQASQLHDVMCSAKILCRISLFVSLNIFVFTSSLSDIKIRDTAAAVTHIKIPYDSLDFLES